MGEVATAAGAKMFGVMVASYALGVVSGIAIAIIAINLI